MGNETNLVKIKTPFKIKLNQVPTFFKYLKFCHIMDWSRRHGGFILKSIKKSMDEKDPNQVIERTSQLDNIILKNVGIIGIKIEKEDFNKEIIFRCRESEEMLVETSYKFDDITYPKNLIVIVNILSGPVPIDLKTIITNQVKGYLEYIMAEFKVLF